MTLPFLRTAHGRDLILSQPDAVSIDDIAAHLAKINRFNGATRLPYSVAQHSLWVAGMIALNGHDAATQMAGLLHDAPEAYLGDLITPVQWHLFGAEQGRNILDTPWEAAHNALADAIHAACGLTVTAAMRDVVKYFDLMALRTEWRDLMTGPEPPGFDRLPGPDPQIICPFPDWRVAEAQFLACYGRLAEALATEALR